MAGRGRWILRCRFTDGARSELASSGALKFAGETSGAEAQIKTSDLTAAVNRCATQKLAATRTLKSERRCGAVLFEDRSKLCGQHGLFSSCFDLIAEDGEGEAEAEQATYRSGKPLHSLAPKAGVMGTPAMRHPKAGFPAHS